MPGPEGMFSGGRVGEHRSKGIYTFSLFTERVVGADLDSANQEWSSLSSLYSHFQIRPRAAFHLLLFPGCTI